MQRRPGKAGPKAARERTRSKTRPRPWNDAEGRRNALDAPVGQTHTVPSVWPDRSHDPSVEAAAIAHAPLVVAPRNALASVTADSSPFSFQKCKVPSSPPVAKAPAPYGSMQAAMGRAGPATSAWSAGMGIR